MKTLIRTLLTITLVAGIAAGRASASDGSGSPAVTQTLELSEGWNLVALTVRPPDATLAEVLAPVLGDIVLVRDHEGRTVVPRLQIDEIGEWDVRTAYEIFARGDVSLTLSGTPLEDEDLTFELVAGWNAVPFVGRIPIPVSDLFGNDVVLVQDSKGRTYWPENEIDEIGELVPGAGYQVFASRTHSVEMHRVNRSVYTVPDYIDTTGEADVSADIMEFISSVPDGSIIEFIQDAVYRIEFPILLEGRSDLEINGNGATFVAKTIEPYGPSHSDRDAARANRVRSHWSIEDGVRILIKNMIVRGANPFAGLGDLAYNSSYEAQHGFNIRGGSDVHIDSVHVYDVYGDFVYIARYKDVHNWARDIRITNSHFERNGRQGVAIVGADGVTIEGNYISSVRRSVFDIEPNTEDGGGVNIFIRDNEIGTARLRWLAAHGRGGRVENVVIEGNQTVTAMNITVDAPEGTRRGPFVIRNNYGVNEYGTPRGYLMRFTRTNDVTVVDNYHPVQRSRGMVGVLLRDVCSFDVSGNVFPNSVGEVTAEVNEGCE